VVSAPASLPSSPKPLRSFYLTAYRQALATGKVWHHDYECSSPESFRLFHQAFYPLHEEATVNCYDGGIPVTIHASRGNVLFDIL
jgi:hypothetical protein